MKHPRFVASAVALGVAGLWFGSLAAAQDDEEDPCLEECWRVAQSCYQGCESSDDPACEEMCDHEVEVCEAACE